MEREPANQSEADTTNSGSESNDEAEIPEAKEEKTLRLYCQQGSARKTKK